MRSSSMHLISVSGLELSLNKMFKIALSVTMHSLNYLVSFLGVIKSEFWYLMFTFPQQRVMISLFAAMKSSSVSTRFCAK